jgi:hypothetical protein
VTSCLSGPEDQSRGLLAAFLISEGQVKRPAEYEPMPLVVSRQGPFGVKGVRAFWLFVKVGSGGFRKSLQGIQERQQIGGVCAVQIPVKSTHPSRFAAMHADGAINRCRAIVMGQSSGLREDVG